MAFRDARQIALRRWERVVFVATKDEDTTATIHARSKFERA
jgi:hypothetical protein